MAEPEASPEFEDRRRHSLWERLDAIEQECRRGHKALRQGLNEVEAQADTFDHDLKALTATVAESRTATVDINRARFSPAVVVSIIIVTVSIVGSAYGVGTMVMGRIDALSLRMDRAVEAQKLERENTTKLQDERAAHLASDISAIKAQQTMQDLRLTNLREMLLSKGK